MEEYEEEEDEYEDEEDEEETERPVNKKSELENKILEDFLKSDRKPPKNLSERNEKEVRLIDFEGSKSRKSKWSSSHNRGTGADSDANTMNLRSNRVKG